MKLYLELTLEIKFSHLLTRYQCRHYRPFFLALPTDPRRYFSNQFDVTFNCQQPVCGSEDLQI